MVSRRIFPGLAGSCRPHWSSPVIPVSSLCVLVWLFLNFLLWCALGCLISVEWNPWIPSLFGWPLHDVLLAGDAGLALVVILDLAGRIRRPWRRDRIYRLGCWMALGCLVLLFSFHSIFRKYRLEGTDFRLFQILDRNKTSQRHLVISCELMKPDTRRQVRRAVTESGGRVSPWSAWNFYGSTTIMSDQPVLIIPLRGFDLVIDHDQARAQGISYGSISGDPVLRVTPAGVFTEYPPSYLGPLPPGAYRALEEQLRRRLDGDGPE